MTSEYSLDFKYQFLKNTVLVYYKGVNSEVKIVLENPLGLITM